MIDFDDVDVVLELLNKCQRVIIADGDPYIVKSAVQMKELLIEVLQLSGHNPMLNMITQQWEI